MGKVRDRIHEGHLLLSHPLSGSVKPNETPYKSVMIVKPENWMKVTVNYRRSHRILCKFEFKSEKYRIHARNIQRLQLIDWTLLQSAISSADVW